jgi:hypothetical protein
MGGDSAQLTNIKNKKVSESKNVGLVLLLDGFQVVRMMELFRLVNLKKYRLFI